MASLDSTATIKFVVDPSEVIALASHMECAIVGCSERGTERIQAKLDIFGSPDVRVWFCEQHHRFFAGSTDEHEAVEVQANGQ